MPRYRVLHNFDAEDTVELTVRKGEVVRTRDTTTATATTTGVAEGSDEGAHDVAAETAAVTHDGWVHVEVEAAPQQRRGFVPLAYIQLLPPSPSPPSSTAAPAHDVRDKNNDNDGNDADKATPPPPSHAATPHACTDASVPCRGDAERDGDASVTSVAQRMAELSQQRAELLASLQATLLDAQAEVAACRACGDTVARTLRELDDVLADGQRRTLQCIDEQRAHAVQALSSLSLVVVAADDDDASKNNNNASNNDNNEQARHRRDGGHEPLARHEREAATTRVA